MLIKDTVGSSYLDGEFRLFFFFFFFPPSYSAFFPPKTLKLFVWSKYYNLVLEIWMFNMRSSLASVIEVIIL